MLLVFEITMSILVLEFLLPFNVPLSLIGSVAIHFSRDTFNIECNDYLSGRNVLIDINDLSIIPRFNINIDGVTKFDYIIQ